MRRKTWIGVLVLAGIAGLYVTAYAAVVAIVDAVARENQQKNSTPSEFVALIVGIAWCVLSFWFALGLFHVFTKSDRSRVKEGDAEVDRKLTQQNETEREGAQ